MKFKTDFLNKRGSNRILLILAKQGGELNITNLYHEARVSQDTLYKTIKVLREMGLIEERKEKSRVPPLRFIMLTKKGLKVAVKLLEIEEALSEKL